MGNTGTQSGWGACAKNLKYCAAGGKENIVTDTSTNRDPHTIQPEHDRIVTSIFDVWRSLGRITEVTVTGDCMEPVIRKGAKVVVDSSPRSIGSGDMVVFKNGDHLTVHRVVQVISKEGKQSFLTKGDRNNYCDLAIDEDLVLGKVVRVCNPPGLENTSPASQDAKQSDPQ
jgi:signal peptidase I